MPSEEVKGLRIKRIGLITLVQWLQQVQLNAELTRERTKFVREATEIIKDFDKRRIEIVEQYVEEDEDGEPKMIENQEGKMEYDISEEDRQKAKEEYDEYLDEKVTIPVDGNKTKIKTVAKILKTTDYEFSGQMADQYDIWMTAFEESVPELLPQPYEQS